MGMRPQICVIAHTPKISITYVSRYLKKKKNLQYYHQRSLDVQHSPWNAAQSIIKQYAKLFFFFISGQTGSA